MKDGFRLNYSLKTRNWTKATMMVRDIETGSALPDGALKPITDACDEFLAKMTIDGMAASTIKKFRATLVGTFTKNRKRRENQYTTPLATAADVGGVKFVQNVTLGFLETWRATWTGGPITAAKRIDRLRTFFRWTVARGWLADNPAKGLRPPQQRMAPTMPYDREDVTRLLAACDRPMPSDTDVRRANRQRLKAMILVARFSGLRVSDLVMLDPTKVAGGRILLYMAKTGVPVFVPLPRFVIDELERTPARHGTYWFWNGKTSTEGTADLWRSRLGRIAKRAKVVGAEWHRFRDTFAVELLQQRVPIEQLATLLGHRSIRITEKHYSPWIVARQAQLEADVAAAWEHDPMAQVLTLRHLSDTAKGKAAN